MVPSLDVARYLLRLAAPSEDEDVDCLCHLRLQKLLYYVQGWHLAARGKPLFGGRIQAWTHGPVVQDVYPVFSRFGYQSIPPKEGDEPASLSEQDKTFIRSVWELYKRYSASALRDLTHREAPWKDARGDLEPDARSDAEISHESLRAFFLPKLEERMSKCFQHFNKDLWEKSRRAIETGRLQTTQEIRRELQRRRAGADPG
jgi:uncharacterized phage-associated protein